MALFAEKTCADVLKDVRRHLELITQYPETPPSVQEGDELMAAARLLARRDTQLLGKISSLEVKEARNLQNALSLLGIATEYRELRKNALVALVFVERLEKACQEKLARKTAVRPALKRGPVETYGRMMTAAEFKRLAAVKALESAEPGQLIRCFQAPRPVVEVLMVIDKTAVHNTYAQIGGIGNVGYIVFFKTSVIPVEIGAPRHQLKSPIIEVKFANGTPVEIIQVRRV